MPDSLSAVVSADKIEVRLPYSGQISRVSKRRGDMVAIGDTLCSLDAKLLQADLDKQLADYEKVRARFEIFDREHPNITDDQTGFLKTIVQSELNSSVKSVEISKIRLDQVVLRSPVRGLVMSDGACRPGLYATPSSNSYTILDLDSIHLHSSLELDQLPGFSRLDQLKFSFDLSGTPIPLTPSQLLPQGKKFGVDFYPSRPLDLIIGSSVTITINP